MDRAVQNYAEYDNVVYYLYGRGENVIFKQYNLHFLIPVGSTFEWEDYEGSRAVMKVVDIRYRISMDGSAKMFIDVVVERVNKV